MIEQLHFTEYLRNIKYNQPNYFLFRTPGRDRNGLFDRLTTSKPLQNQENIIFSHDPDGLVKAFFLIPSIVHYQEKRISFQVSGWIVQKRPGILSTLDRRYSAVCGYTQEELETVFSGFLTGFDNSEVKRWYNGYSWTGEKVYNPFDILLLFDEGVFKPYWFETGTPGFLLTLWTSQPRLPAEYEGLIAGEDLLGSFDPEHIRTETLLFQAGYLTIHEWLADPVRGFVCKLGYPNIEVRTSLNMLFAQALIRDTVSENREKLYQALNSDDNEQLRIFFTALFASIPHDWFRKNSISRFEGYYSSVVYTCFASLGFDVIPEDTTNKGRIDLTVKTPTGIWIFEFKVLGADSSGETNPLEQIKLKNYREKYESDPRTIHEIGIGFNPLTRNIETWGNRMRT